MTCTRPLFGEFFVFSLLLGRRFRSSFRSDDDDDDVMIDADKISLPLFNGFGGAFFSLDKLTSKCVLFLPKIITVYRL